MAGGEFARNTESKKCDAKRLASDLVLTGTGRAGLDVPARESATLTPSLVHSVPTGVWGPTGDNIDA